MTNAPPPTERAPKVPQEKRAPREKLARGRVGTYQFEKRGISRFDLRDPYHLAVALSWPQFLAALFGLYLAVTSSFALLYWLVPGSVGNAREDSFADVFFFSIETLATVGYGEMFPGSTYGRIVAAGEIVCGLAFTAILTGLTFVRFSRPRAKIVFAANPVVAMHNAKPTLMIRIGNGRTDILTDAVAKVSVLLSETTLEGRSFRSARELRLLRAQIPIFPLAWTLMHVLDEASPLHGFDSARAVEAGARVFVTFEAHDPTLATVVREMRNYGPEDIGFGMRYVDAVSTSADGMLTVDLTRISALEPDTGGEREAGAERDEAEGGT